MTQPGEQRPRGLPVASPPTTRSQRPPAVGWATRLRPRSLTVAVMEALVAGGIAALAWALLRGILELSLGLLAVAVAGGWAIGTIIRQVRPSPALAAGMGAAAGCLALLLTWLVAMAILPESSRTFAERLAATSFPDWLAPQLGALEIASVVLFAGVAAYAARTRSTDRTVGGAAGPDGG